MKLIIYKGFNVDFLKKLSATPLIKNDIFAKKDILKFDMRLKRKLASALLGMDEDDEFWISYEEYAFIKDQVDVAIKDYNLKLVIYVNNLFPDYYPVEIHITDELLDEIISTANTENSDNVSDNCKLFFQIYNSIIIIEKKLYASFYNYEYEKIYDVQIVM